MGTSAVVSLGANVWTARSPLVPAPEPHLLYDAAKRGIDMVLAAGLLLAALPVLLLACIAIWLTTGEAPVLAQRRVGLLGQEFTMLKLRTMRGPDAGALVDLTSGDVFGRKHPADRRITRVGRLLRRTSIDELPQLLNVLAGQMSLVGPRPGLLAEVVRYPAPWTRRLTVKPGLTGLWQVSGRSFVRPRRWMAMDRYYAGRRSLALDAAIALRTVAAVLSMRGAW
jgi:lipopolysaccharide/colanic/teichoic acid biosynthesis glycosyltransferase